MNDEKEQVNLLTPAYDFSVAPESLHIGSDLELTIIYKGKKYELVADIVCEFQPKPSIFIRTNIELESLDLWDWDVSDSSDFKFILDGQKIAAFIKRRGGFSLGSAEPVQIDITLRKTPLALPVQDDLTHLNTQYSIFHLFNFPQFGFNRPVVFKSADSTQLLQCIVLESDGWKIVIQELPSSEDAFKAIKEIGGSYLTHVAKISKTNAVYSHEEYKKHIRLLRVFLSFVQGGDFRVVCAVGFNVDGVVSWREWNAPKLISRPPYSWFCTDNPQQAERLFPLFGELWKISPSWQETLKVVVYWYNQASLGGVGLGIDTSIILAQAALERLAYQYLVIDKKAITEKGFSNLWASDKLRLFFSALNIPLVISSSTPAIQSVSNNLNWIDAPHALTVIRNSLVHPKTKNFEEIQKCFVDGWKLTLWYLELSILALCEYEGTYANRLTQKFRGDVESVPWAQKD